MNLFKKIWRKIFRKDEMQSYSDFAKTLSDNQKKLAKELFGKFSHGYIKMTNTEAELYAKKLIDEAMEKRKILGGVVCKSNIRLSDDMELLPDEDKNNT